MAEQLASGALRKMHTELSAPVSYALPLGEELLPLNPYLGQTIRLEYAGQINCIYCDRKTNKSFNQGYCFPCFKRLARCDACIVSPEKCHYAAGTCREPEWGEANCMIDHYVYLANTSGIKVGITRGSQVPTRWMDQGAAQARPIFRVSSRLQSGLVETLFSQHIADKTNWRAMLKGPPEAVDFEAVRLQLMNECSAALQALWQSHGLQSITELTDEAVVDIEYPVLEYPQKVSSFNLDKNPVVEGTLLGIKGQYLIFDSGVINMRKYGGYSLTLSASA
ncbi:MAG: DUF2797 domain-containing protein [Halioglobus sp.]